MTRLTEPVPAETDPSADGERVMPEARWTIAGCAARQPSCVEA